MGPPSGYDIIAAFGVDDNQYSARMRPAQNDEPVFGLRVRRIGNGDGKKPWSPPES
jgi:hypothetical protein